LALRDLHVRADVDSESMSVARHVVIRRLREPVHVEDAVKGFVLALLLCAAPAAAEDTAFRVSMVAAISAHGADLSATSFCIGAGLCRELNPFLGRFENPAVFGAVKSGIAGLQLWAVAKLHEHRPKLAIAVNYLVAGVFVGIAAHNLRAAR
jgi:hypothetical protein